MLPHCCVALERAIRGRSKRLQRENTAANGMIVPVNPLLIKMCVCVCVMFCRLPRKSLSFEGSKV